MALIATVAVALAAVFAAVASGGHGVAGFVVTPALYGLALVPGVLRVAARRTPPAVAVPPQAATAAKVALLFGALYLFSGRGRPPGVTGLVAILGLGVIGLSFVWPRPGALRLSLAFSVVALVAPGGADSAGRGGALAAMAAAAAVALVATNRLAVPAAASVPRPRRIAGETAVVGAVLAVAGLASILFEPPSRAASAGGSSSGEPAASAQPGAPLSYLDQLDPARQEDASPGRGDDGHGDQVVLRVGAHRPDVWRAQTFEQWDGRRWHASPAPPGGPPARQPVLFVPLDPFERSPSDQLVQRVEVVASFAAVAVGAPKAYFFELPGPATVTPDGSVLPVPALGRGAAYETTSGRSPATPSMLRASDADRAGAPVPDAWLAVPRLSERARVLAATVTAGAPTTYDKVRALEEWLARHAEVDDHAAPLPAGADVVDTVAFTERAGTPERLATALAVLSRAAGVPARLATGFLPGERPLFGGDFVVRSRHAHAWVEVPFPGLGWQRFDATGRLAAAEGGDSVLSRIRRLLSRYWWVFVAVLVAVAAGLARWLVLRRHKRMAIPWATMYFARLTRLGASRGRPRVPSETPAEYAGALADGVLADERLRRVGEVVTAAAWSSHEPSEETRRWAEEVLRAAASATRRRSRLLR